MERDSLSEGNGLFGNINNNMVDWLHRTEAGWAGGFVTGVKKVFK